MSLTSAATLNCHLGHPVLEKSTITEISGELMFIMLENILLNDLNKGGTESYDAVIVFFLLMYL